MQTTLGVIPDAFVDDVLREGLLILVSLTRGARNVMMLRLMMVVAMGYFPESMSSLHPRAVSNFLKLSEWKHSMVNDVPQQVFM